MARSANDLIVGIGADLKALERELKKAGVVVESAVDKIEKDFSNINPKMAWAAGIGTALGNIAAGAVAGLVEALKKANDQLLEMEAVAKRTGVTIGDIARLQAAGGTGVVGALDAIGKSLNDARHGATDLGKLFEANGVKANNANEGLLRLADLVRNAATEYDKIKIVELANVSRDMIPFLEQGSEAIKKQADASSITNQQMQEAAQKAREFKDAWDELSKIVQGVAQPALLTILGAAQDIAAEGRQLLEAWGPWIKALEKVIQNYLPAIANMAKPAIKPLDSSLFGEDPPGEPRELTVRGGRRTVIPTGGGGGRSSGGGGGRQGLDSVEAYISAMQRQVEILRVEAEAQGKSNIQREIAIRLAEAEHVARRAGITLTDEQRRRIEEEATARARLNEQIRANKAAQDAYNDAVQFGGQQLLNVFDQIAEGGANARDVLRDLAKTLAKTMLQAALLGQGPLAGILGMSNPQGGVGGLLGMLAGVKGMHAGGQVYGGRPYVVGEKGPELFMPGKGGMIVPNSALGRGGGASSAQAPIAIEVRVSPSGEFDARVANTARQVANVTVRSYDRMLPNRITDIQKRT